MNLFQGRMSQRAASGPFSFLAARNDPQQTFPPAPVRHATRHAFHHSRSRRELRTVEVIRP
jgi:hypothetical protein